MRSLFLSLILLFCILVCYPQETVIRPYVGVSAGNLLITGSYDGSSFFQTDQDFLLVPRIKPALGLGGVAGVRINNGAAEIGYYYYRSSYTTMEDDYSGECSIHLIRILGMTKYLNKYADRVVSPYFDIDISTSYAVFKKIAYPFGQYDNSSSGSYGAFILGMGAGTLLRLSDNLAIDLKILAEYYLGTDIRVKGRDQYEIKKFGNLLANTTLGLKYYFKAK